MPKDPADTVHHSAHPSPVGGGWEWGEDGDALHPENSLESGAQAWWEGHQSVCCVCVHGKTVEEDKNS